jgi:hypothetical protein
LFIALLATASIASEGGEERNASNAILPGR